MGMQRESIWFTEKVYDFLNANKISLAWSVRDELKTPPVVTSDRIYIRFIGDRAQMKMTLVKL